MRTESLLDAFQVNDVFKKKYQAIYLKDDLEKVYGIAKETSQNGFLIFNESKEIIGSIDLNKIFINEEKQVGKVEEIYLQEWASVNVYDTLKMANESMQENGTTILAVYREEQLIGIIEEQMIWQHLDKSMLGI